MDEKNVERRRPCAQPARFVAVAMLLSIFAAPAVGQNTNTCGEQLEEAETSYVEGRFDEAIRLVLRCLDRNDVETAQAIDAYRLLALALIRKDELPDARAAIVQLLDVYPEYEPDPIVDPPSFRALVDIVKQQLSPVATDTSEPPARRSWFRSNLKWILPGGAVVVGGVLAAVLAQGGGSGGPSQLPPPPGAPN